MFNITLCNFVSVQIPHSWGLVVHLTPNHHHVWDSKSWGRNMPGKLLMELQDCIVYSVSHFKISGLFGGKQLMEYLIYISNISGYFLSLRIPNGKRIYIWLKMVAAAEAVAADANKCKNRKECNKFTYTHVSRPISHVVLGHQF